MSELKVGQDFPEGVVFGWIPPAPESADVRTCGIPTKYDLSKDAKDKKIVVVAIPGAFTPTCSANHLPSYIEKHKEIKAKGVDKIIFIAYNDEFVMSGWGKANNITDDSILFMSDLDAKWSQTIGWATPPRTGRFAVIIDHGKVAYAAQDLGKSSIANSGADGVLAQL
ncbi:hypothetical protein TD95_004965 [Thielaviopsis punctulata]|uniref:Thioredoxin domain-containing protein n=1 Tax=Thielaviopsis punctulata TaxID=72032 RepID=A0A0F4ZB87_9PEZI|nr:hypothetical protein TD95_004965 [Thielaviopsis punctulata]